MSDLNTFMRRADVEALLDAKMMAANDRIADWHTTLLQMLGADKPDHDAAAGMLTRITDEKDRAGALRVAKRHLDTLDQFTLVGGMGPGSDPEHTELRDRSGYAVEPK